MGNALMMFIVYVNHHLEDKCVKRKDVTMNAQVMEYVI